MKHLLLSITLLCCPFIFTSADNLLTPPDYSAYILTPPAPESPRINSSKVFGVRPGSPFLYNIAATGKRPMTFSADGLPKGLTLDAQTGFIRGRVKKAGTYHVKLYATNSLGKAERNLRIEVGQKIALTPPMGWNSWNCWGNSVSQDKVMSSAKAMVEKGLVNYGWSYINIDDGWQGIRGGKFHGIQPDRKFPDMKKLADDLHNMGLKLGIYSGPWLSTYAGHIGSQCNNPQGTYEWIEAGKHNANYKYVTPEDTTGNKVRKENWHHAPYSFAKQDADQWGEWGIDYLKYDLNPNYCYNTLEMLYSFFSQKRDIVFSLSNSAAYV